MHRNLAGFFLVQGEASALCAPWTIPSVRVSLPSACPATRRAGRWWRDEYAIQNYCHFLAADGAARTVVIKKHPAEYRRVHSQPYSPDSGDVSGSPLTAFTSNPETSRKIASKSQPTRRCPVFPHASGGKNSNPSGVHCPATPFSAARTAKTCRSRSCLGKYSSLSAFGQ